MFSRNIYSSAAIIGFLIGATAGGFAYKKANEFLDNVLGKTESSIYDSNFLKFMAIYGFAGSAVSVSTVSLFSCISRHAPVIGKYNPNRMSLSS